MEYALLPCQTLAFAIVAVLIVSYAIARGGTAWRPSRRRPTDPLDGVRLTDPGFTWPLFCARALTVYDGVQRARMVRQPEMARGFVTSELMRGLDNAARFGLAGRTLTPLKVTGIGPVRAGVREGRRTLTVRIVAESSAEARSVLGGGTGTPFGAASAGPAFIDELWTFERDLSAHTAPAVAIDRCPRCGAPVRDPYSGICGYCRHALRAASDDWRASWIEPTPPLAEIAS